MTNLVSEDKVNDAIKPVIFKYRVLLRAPVSRSVPIMGIGVAAARPESEVFSVSATDTEKVLNRQTYGFLRRKDYGDYQFQITRHRQSLRLAFYATWLAFSEQDDAYKFEKTHPEYGIHNLIAGINKKRENAERDLEKGLKKSSYDLSLIASSKRVLKAKLFISTVEDIKALQYSGVKLEKLLSHLAEHPIQT